MKKERVENLKKRMLTGYETAKSTCLLWRGKIKKLKLKKIRTSILRKIKKLYRKLSDSWKLIFIGIPSFLFCYYVIGALISENIDVNSVDKKQNIALSESQTIETMRALLKREVDEHIWAANLPPVFPAYILDNMPNFQIGVVQAIRDIVKVIKTFPLNDEAKRKSLNKAARLLSYKPDIWILSQKSAFSIAPSSNSQYRKARKELEKVNENGYILSSTADLSLILKNMALNLQKMSAKNEERVREFSSDYFDFKSDDIFYHNKGYAFGLWQITDALAVDFKAEILTAEAYGDWTLLVSNLQKAAKYEPAIVRNGNIQSAFAPNHIMIQNYYLSMSRAQAEKIINMLEGKIDAGAN